jgi:hypothetical protein
MPEIRSLDDATSEWLAQESTESVETLTFDPLPSSDAAASASGDAVAAAVQENAADQEAQREMIAALLGETTMPLDPELRIPVVVAGETQYMTLQEMRQSGMRTADYTRKTQEVAEMRRTVEARERELRVASATIEAQQNAMEQERERLLIANQDPDEYAKYIRHVELLQADPEYKANWERGQRALLREATDAATSAIEAEEHRAAVVRDIEEVAVALTEQFPGVRAEDAIAVYTARLQAGQADLRTGHLRKAFADLAKERESIVTPLQTQIEALSKTVAELTAAQQAAAINAPRRAALAATSAAPVSRPTTSPNAGAPVAPSAPTRRRIQSLEEAGQAWAKR